MVTYTTPLKGRDTRKLKLTAQEALDMLKAGFHFSIFEPIQDVYELSLPWRLVFRTDTETVLLEQ